MDATQGLEGRPGTGSVASVPPKPLHKPLAMRDPLCGPPRLHTTAEGKTQGALAEGKVILQFAFKAVV